MMLQRACTGTASAELLLSRMPAKIDDLCRERETIHDAQGAERKPDERRTRF
jgi:hypothetical protein